MKSTKLLELEKREAIGMVKRIPLVHVIFCFYIDLSCYQFETGEILKLNASFKAPPDYKPLLKEDKVVIPVSLCAPFLHYC